MPFRLVERRSATIPRMIIAVGAFTSIFLAHGCAAPALVAGTAAGTAGVVVIGDKRTPAELLDDQIIESKARKAIDADPALIDDVNVAVTSYDRMVLLTGQVPSEEIRRRVIGHVRGIEKVREIHDHLEIEEPTMLPQRTRDTLITAHVKSVLMEAQGIPSAKVKVVTEHNVVYLMGKVRREDVGKITDIVQKVDGVKLIVLVFEYST
jgi:osmotically-inducible protein OsmY